VADLTGSPDDGSGEPDAVSDRVRWWGLAAVMVSAVTTGLTIGMTIPLIALTMAAAGAGTALIGINAAMPALGILLTAPLAPWLIAVLGLVPTLVLGCVVSAVSLVLFPVFDSMVGLFALRIAAGFGLALLWVVSETWLSRLAIAQNRGRIVGLYSTLWSAGMVAGPLLLQLTGFGGLLPFAMGSALILLAAVPPVLGRAAARGRQTGAGHRRWSWVLFGMAPGTILAGFITGFVETSLFTLLPLYGVAAGLESAVAVVMLSVFAAGGFASQLPFGWLADRLGPARVLIGAALVALTAALALAPAMIAGWVLWPLLFVWGGAVSGFYTLGLTQLGQRVGLASLTQANVLFIMAYTVGTLVGPTLAGTAMEVWPVHGLPLVVVVVYCGFLLAAVPVCKPGSR